MSDMIAFQTTLMGVVQKLKDRLLTLEARVQELESAAQAAASRKRTPTLYPVWKRVMDHVNAGEHDAGVIAKALGIPYTTVRAYVAWEQDKIDQKKDEWEAYPASKQISLLQKAGF